MSSYLSSRSIDDKPAKNLAQISSYVQEALNENFSLAGSWNSGSYTRRAITV